MRRRRDEARQPLQVTVMVGLLLPSITGLVAGPRGSAGVLSMDAVSQRMFAGLMVFATTAILISALLANGFGACLELGGMVGIAFGLTAYSTALIDVIPYWATSVGAGYIVIGAGCLVRAWQVIRTLRRYYVIPFCPRRWWRGR
jgi:hypothetical protein